MSFIETEDHEWAVDAWPEGIQFGAGLNLPAYCAKNQAWVTVPIGLADMLDWAYVHRVRNAADYTREHLLLYKKPPATSDNALFPVGIRVQGFVLKAALAPLGTWDGKRNTAVSAIQTLALGCGGHEEPWRATIAALTSIQQLVHTALVGGGYDDSNYNRGHREIVDREADIVLPDNIQESRDTPDEWMVTKKLSSGRLVCSVDNDYFEPYDSRAIAEGDFVDVCIGFDIVAKRNFKRGEPTYQLRFTIQHIILLKKAEDVVSGDSPETYRAVPVTVIDQGIQF
ncbi:hypothetical protein C8J57DRAFT_1540385 [Mycena rebaudengoi]|nr:hypothetical protein C8J57DRAFT_1540385 [Mycena rebaudengoi]